RCRSAPSRARHGKTSPPALARRAGIAPSDSRETAAQPTKFSRAGSPCDSGDADKKPPRPPVRADGLRPHARASSARAGNTMRVPRNPCRSLTKKTLQQGQHLAAPTHPLLEAIDPLDEKIPPHRIGLLRSGRGESPDLFLPAVQMR